MLESWSSLSKTSSKNIVISIYNCMQQIMLKCEPYISHQFEAIWKTFCESVECAMNEKPLKHPLFRPLIVKAIDSVINTLKVMFSSAIMKEQSLTVSAKYQLSLYDLLKKLLKAMRSTKNDPLKVFAEEKVILDFIDFLPKTFTSAEQHNNYVEFLLDLLTFSADDPCADGTIRAVASIIASSITLQKLPPSIVKKTLRKLFKKLESVIELRFDNTVCKILMENAKEEQPLWYEMGECFIAVATYLASPKLSASMEEELSGVKWECMLEFVKSVFVIRETSLYYLEKPLMEQVIRKSQELDVRLVTFVHEFLLKSSKGLADGILKELVTIIDSGCVAINVSRFNFSSYGNTENSLSKLSLNILFDLCNAKASGDPTYTSLKKRISPITTLALVNRCKELFHTYRADEKRSGRVPLPK